MSSVELENLHRIGKLKPEPPLPREQRGLLESATSRLRDSTNTTLSFDSRFDLAYNAAHAFALWALRQQGYRSDNRYLVFQCLPHTAGVPTEVWKVLAKAHERRNRAEYEGYLDHDDRLLSDMIGAARQLAQRVAQLNSTDAR